MVGILVRGDNHFIVHGPLPGREVALALIRHWSIIQVGATTPPPLEQWQIISRAFRENLEWAVVVPGDDKISPAVTVLLDELSMQQILLFCGMLRLRRLIPLWSCPIKTDLIGNGFSQKAFVGSTFTL